jgi:hypothetical protein
MSAYNYAKAFIAFQQGNSFDDISTMLQIPLETLKMEARQHGWSRLADQIAAPLRELAKVDLDLDLIKKNRKKSLEEAGPLETLFARRLELYGRAWEELQVAEAQWIMDQEEYSSSNKTDEDKIKLDSARSRLDQSRAAAAPSAKSLAELGKAVAILQDIRYRALGDQVNKTNDDKPAAAGARTLIQINLPDSIARPRQGRTIDVQAVKRQDLPPES